MNPDRIDGKIALAAGGSSGVGLAIAKGLARLGARTIIVSRSERGARSAVDEIRLNSGTDAVEHVICDLTDAKSVGDLVRSLDERLPGLDVLISAAASVGETGLVANRIPKSFATNYLGHFSLIEAALPLLKRTPGSRILVVGAAPALIKRLGDVDYNGVDSTASGTRLLRQALAWKLLLAHHLATTHPDGPSINIVHPGLIRSNLLRTQSAPLRLFGWVSNRLAKEDCAVVEHLASSPSMAGVSGRMFDDGGHEVPLPRLVTTEHAAAIWRASSAMIRPPR